jgi:UDP-N-acetylmuramate--alanine ligase
LASVLVEAGLDPSFVIGGIHQKWKTNGKAGKGDYFVAEADESDGSFLKTKSFGAIVTNLENDHIDFWKEPKLLDEAFGKFFDQAQNEKHLFWCGDDERLAALKPKGVSYGFGQHNELRILGDTFEWNGKKYENIELSLTGDHNKLNAAAVFGLSLSLGIEERVIRKALAEFAGTARRLEWKGKSKSVDVYDDYGHHPTEIKATLKGLRQKVKERRVVAVFQPHRYSRVSDLFHEFSTSFEDADLVLLTDIYSAGEKEVVGLNESFISHMKKQLGSKLEHMVSGFAARLEPHDVVITMGAGDVTKAGAVILSECDPKWTVGLIFGGTTSEHAVTLMSARTYVESIDRTLYDVKLFGLSKEGVWTTGDDALDRLERKEVPTGEMISAEVLHELTSCDVTVPIFHGQQGEDGMAQGFLEMLNIPYVGCDYRSAALCMQKGWTKQVAIAAGIRTSQFIEVQKTAYRKNQNVIVDKYPVWVKPVHLGSSIGITRVTKQEDLKAAIETAFALDDALIIDQEVEGREIEFSLLGNDYVRVGPAAEISKPDVFHSYDKKYGAGASHIETPAKITELERRVGEELAIRMYQAAGCKGLSRIDFFLDKEGLYWMNEINPMPGFTKTSAYPQAWGSAGMPRGELCNELLILAMHRSRQLKMIRGK